MKPAFFPAALVTLSSKGQFTIPKRLRDQLGLLPGARVELTLLPDGFALRRQPRSIVEQTAGSLTRYAKPARRQPNHASSKGGEPL